MTDINREHIIKSTELKTVPTKDNGEKLVALQNEDFDIDCTYIKYDMRPYTGEKMYVRESVSEKLQAATKELKKLLPKAKLKLAYAYRHPDVQKKYFEQRKSELKDIYPDEKESVIEEMAHSLSAKPEVAGHPTGAAIDITIVDNDKEINMGTKIADFSDREMIKTFFKDISKEQKKNRMLLRQLLLDHGFAPFDGEWWHFSYGDLEWAAYYNKPHAIYESKTFSL